MAVTDVDDRAASAAPGGAIIVRVACPACSGELRNLSGVMSCWGQGFRTEDGCGFHLSADWGRRWLWADPTSPKDLRCSSHGRAYLIRLRKRIPRGFKLFCKHPEGCLWEGLWPIGPQQRGFQVAEKPQNGKHRTKVRVLEGIARAGVSWIGDLERRTQLSRGQLAGVLRRSFEAPGGAWIRRSRQRVGLNPSGSAYMWGLTDRGKGLLAWATSAGWTDLTAGELDGAMNRADNYPVEWE